MVLPDYQTLMLPLLKTLSDKKEHKVQEITNHLIKTLGINEKDREIRLLSGKQTIIENRIAWAKTYLKKAGLIENTQRGIIKILGRGLKVLEQNPKEINNEFLEQFDGFKEFTKTKREDENEELQSLEVPAKQTAQESIEYGIQKINKNLAEQILKSILDCSPKFFENLVIDLLLKMGYGGSRKDAGESIGRTGDGGIDGIIKEDKLGLSIIYIQAKKWGGVVGRPEIQKFAGALQGNKASKGIIITTSYFSKEAKDYVNNINTKIILIDSEMLTGLMIEHNVGVSTTESYEIKKIDNDYFIEE